MKTRYHTFRVDFPLNSQTIKHNLIAEIFLSTHISYCYVNCSKAVLSGLVGLVFLGVWRQPGRVVLMCWRMVGGRKRQLLFISMRGRPLWEDEWRGAFQKISESERVGRHQDIIREVCLLPCYYRWNKWFSCFRLNITPAQRCFTRYYMWAVTQIWCYRSPNDTLDICERDKGRQDDKHGISVAARCQSEGRRWQTRTRILIWHRMQLIVCSQACFIILSNFLADWGSTNSVLSHVKQLHCT